MYSRISCLILLSLPCFMRLPMYYTYIYIHTSYPKPLYKLYTTVRSRKKRREQFTSEYNVDNRTYGFQKLIHRRIRARVFSSHMAHSRSLGIFIKMMPALLHSRQTGTRFLICQHERPKRKIVSPRIHVVCTIQFVMPLEIVSIPLHQVQRQSTEKNKIKIVIAIKAFHIIMQIN